MSYPYDPQSPWPFPSLPVTVYQIDSNQSTPELSALLDTGADVSLVATSHLETIGADEIYTANLRMHWGNPNSVGIYLVDLEVAGYRLPAIEVVADDQSDGVLLGRNVLNKLILLLDGPQQQTDVLESRPTRL